LRGREWKNPQGEVKYFNSIQGWRIDKADATIESATALIDEHIEPESDGLPF